MARKLPPPTSIQIRNARKHNQILAFRQLRKDYNFFVRHGTTNPRKELAGNYGIKESTLDTYLQGRIPKEFRRVSGTFVTSGRKRRVQAIFRAGRLSDSCKSLTRGKRLREEIPFRKRVPITFPFKRKNALIAVVKVTTFTSKGNKKRTVEAFSVCVSEIKTRKQFNSLQGMATGATIRKIPYDAKIIDEQFFIRVYSKTQGAKKK